MFTEQSYITNLNLNSNTIVNLSKILINFVIYLSNSIYLFIFTSWWIFIHESYKEGSVGPKYFADLHNYDRFTHKKHSFTRFYEWEKEMYCIQSKYTPTLLLSNESYIHYQQLWMLMHTCLIRQPFTMTTFFCEYLWNFLWVNSKQVQNIIVC